MKQKGGKKKTVKEQRIAELEVVLLHRDKMTWQQMGLMQLSYYDLVL